MTDPLHILDDTDAAALLRAAVEGTLDAETHAQLAARIAGEPQVRDAYLRLMHLHAMLHWQQGAGVDLHESGISARAENSKLEVRNSKQNRPLAHARAGEASSFEFRASSLTLALAAAILLAATAWFTLPLSSNPQSEIDNPQSPSVALLTNTDNAVFAASPAPMNLGGSLPAGPIRLTSGSAQIMFASTAMVDLTGPCEFEMTGPNRGRLTSGSLEAFVPENAKGFTVDLPGGARVIDRGTRFTIDAEDTGTIRLHVFEGQVAAGYAAEPFTTLKAGEAAVIKPASRHLARVATAPYDDTYTQRLLRLEPTAYWPLQNPSQPWVDRVSGRSAKAQDVDRLEGTSGVVRALFNGRTSTIDTTDDDLIPAEGDFSLSAWFATADRGDLADQGQILSNNPSGMRHGRANLTVSGGQLSWFIGSAGADPQVHLRPAVDVADGLWHHAAVTRRGDHWTLYLDGAPVAETDRSAVIDAGQYPWHIGSSARPGKMVFNGQLAHLAVFDAALSPEQIRQLANHADKIPSPSERKQENEKRHDTIIERKN